ncbi:hypothetical protein ACFLV2_00830 [Chloroflexota bacterium]
MDYIYIEKKNELRAYLQSLTDARQYILALDIEAELNRHAYGETLCLIQIFDGVSKLIIDPFKIDTPTLRMLFGNRDILKIMYDAASDLHLIKNTLNMDIKSILDLRPAVHLLNYEKQDLHSVLARELGIQLENKKKYQKRNWTKRPIPEEAIDYALNDVTHLFRLKDALLSKLSAGDLLDRYLLKNLQVQNKDYTRRPDDKYKKVKGYHNLSDSEQTVLRKVYDVRDKYAERFNMPPHNIVHNNDLIGMIKGRSQLDEIRLPRRLDDGIKKQIMLELRKAITTV